MTRRRGRRRKQILDGSWGNEGLLKTEGGGTGLHIGERWPRKRLSNRHGGRPRNEYTESRFGNDACHTKAYPPIMDWCAIFPSYYEHTHTHTHTHTLTHTLGRSTRHMRHQLLQVSALFTTVTASHNLPTCRSVVT